MHRWFCELANYTSRMHRGMRENGNRERNLGIRLSYIYIYIIKYAPRRIKRRFGSCRRNKSRPTHNGNKFQPNPTLRAVLLPCARVRSKSSARVEHRGQYSKSALHPCQFSCSLIASYVPHPIMIRYSSLQFPLPCRL